MARPVNQPDLETPAGRFAARIRHLRMRRGFQKQSDFADAMTERGVDVTFRAISNWERAYNVPRFFDVPIVASVLGVDVESMYEGVYPNLQAVQHRAYSKPNRLSKINTNSMPLPVKAGAGRSYTQRETEFIDGLFAHRLVHLYNSTGYKNRDEWTQQLTEIGYSVDENTVGNWMLGYFCPQVLFIPHVAYTLRVTLDDLFFGVYPD